MARRPPSFANKATRARLSFKNEFSRLIKPAEFLERVTTAESGGVGDKHGRFRAPDPSSLPFRKRRPPPPRRPFVPPANDDKSNKKTKKKNVTDSAVYTRDIHAGKNIYYFFSLSVLLFPTWSRKFFFLTNVCAVQYL